MALSLQIRQAQKQALSPAMWLGINLLTLPVVELRESVKKEIESNPALEIERPSGVAGLTRSVPTAETGTDFFESVAAESGESLEEHLMSEIRMSEMSPREADLCKAIVAELDEDGRFKGSYPDMIMATGATEPELEAARRRVMALDPKGCGARDLAECFLAQIDRIPAAKRADVLQAIEAVATMVEKSAKTAPPQLKPEAIRLLKTLEAFPGRLYEHRKIDFVTPDIVVDENGEVDVDQRDIPELRVSPKYIEMAKDKTLDDETRQYAAERVKRAREYREAVIRCQETMEKVAEIAIGGQQGFLSQGAAGLVKQTMSEVAKKAGCTVATVSRAAARKYVKTPRGTVPFRKFFVLVDQAPIEKLREIISAVPPVEKVSDRELSERMAKAGYKMARRTVAKYRAQFQRA